MKIDKNTILLGAGLLVGAWIVVRYMEQAKEVADFRQTGKFPDELAGAGGDDDAYQGRITLSS